MVRKPTLILLVVFAVLIGLVIFLQKNPQPSKVSQTPSPTPMAYVFPGVEQGSITKIELKIKGSSEVIQVRRDGQNEWVLGPDGEEKVEIGKVEQLRAEITALRVNTQMPEDMIDSALGLVDPAFTLIVQTSQNQKHALQIGDLTPIATGYYAQYNEGTAFVVSNTAVDTIVGLMQELGAPAETPAP